MRDCPEQRVISGVRVVTPVKVLSGASITINKNYFVEIEGSEDPIAGEKEDWLIPGLIDTHVHGAGGADIMDARMDSLFQVAQTLLKLGTTAFLAATMTVDERQLAKGLKTVNSFIRLFQDIDDKETAAAQHKLNGIRYTAECLGIHLEGPFISGRFSGAQKSVYIQEPSVSLLNQFQAWSGNNIRILTLAPELVGCENVIVESIRLGIIPSAGHSAANWLEAQQAKSWGIKHITHGFNAMRGLHHREPGLIGMALADEEIAVEIIADLVHIHQCILDILYRLKGADRLILISDGMRALGMPAGEYELSGQSVRVSQGEARLTDGSLAGSVASLLDGVKTMIFRVGIPIPDAVRMASLIPARLLGIEKRTGSLEKSKEATFLRLDPDWNLKEVWVCGNNIPIK
ncbi:MAG: N-acetylglucosamine-6-phosphate deacetylase [Desulfitobacteriaceae bacterium]|nr:N-acetylglucosamine-6-phosphate deacetylase [Desulfitobacteriaceae bacterium]MDD4400948.1 N-acetylglucosamine-6-phosphate deacetylase [Desulfitobacteriaceae bacterium]